MNNNLGKSILAGALLGVALFIMPFFLIRAIIFLLIIGGLFRLFGRGRYRRGGWKAGYRHGYMPAFADRIRQMSDEEYSQFKQRFEYGGCGPNFDKRSTEAKADSTNPTNL